MGFVRILGRVGRFNEENLPKGVFNLDLLGVIDLSASLWRESQDQRWSLLVRRRVVVAAPVVILDAGFGGCGGRRCCR